MIERWLFFLKKILLIILLFSYIALGVNASKSINECDKYVRLHILANSNSFYDQSVKERVKNFFLSSFYNDLNNLKSKDETLNFIINNKQRVKEKIDGFLSYIGTDYTCEIKVGKEVYNKNSYKSVNLPYGTYDSVKIILGKGKGKNLFFVLFPALCIKEDVTIKDNQSDKIIYKSKLIETLKNIIYK